MVELKPSKPYAEQTYEERAADYRRYLKELKASFMPKAQVLEFPDRLSEQELIRRQAALDAAWQRTLDARAELAAEQAQGCHRGPSDPDWPGRKY
jgi:hypothetical protein